MFHKKVPHSGQNQQQVENHQVVPQQLIWNVKLKTLKAKMQKAAEQDFHEPSRCSACMEERAATARDTFIRTKTTQLQNRLLEEKIRRHLQQHNSVLLIAETLQDLPKPSESPDTTWNKLRTRHKE